MTCRPPCPALTPAFTDSLLYTHVQYAVTGKATRVVLHDSRRGLPLLAKIEKSCSFYERAGRTHCSCAVTRSKGSTADLSCFILNFPDRTRILFDLMDNMCMCGEVGLKYFFCYTVWAELCSQPCKECAQCTHPSIYTIIWIHTHKIHFFCSLYSKFCTEII